MYYLSVIIPCYNESENISGIFNKLSLFDNDVEIVFVDNGSTDNTAERISDIVAEINRSNIKCVTVTTNIGYGHGIMSGVNSASYITCASGNQHFHLISSSLWLGRR